MLNEQYYSQKCCLILPSLTNRSLFGETTAGWIVNASWAWHASYWRSWI